MEKLRIGLVVLGAGLLGFAPALALDDIEGPYGAVNGDIYGRARTTTPLLDWSQGMRKAWEINMNTDPNAIDITFTRSYPVFDAAGNLYWLTSTGGGTGGKQYVASAAPNGTIRWRSAESVDPGPGAGRGGVVVGHDAVYAFAGGNLYDYDTDGTAGYAVAAFNKGTGAKLWLTDIDGDWLNNGTVVDNVDFSSGVTHPLLYNGKLYLVGAGSYGLAVVEINAATGAFLHFKVVDPIATADLSGTLTLVPGVFSGVDGLFMNTAAWSPSTLYGIRLGAAGPELAWLSFGGLLQGRSHLIYSPGTGYLYAHTWNDDRMPFSVYDPVTGWEKSHVNVGNHGYVDVAALAWDDVSAAVGGFDGQVNFYTVDNQGQIAEPVPGYGGTRSWGEMRNFGQLIKKNGQDTRGVLLSTGPSNGPSTCPRINSEVILLDMNRATAWTTPDHNGPAYFDAVEVLGGPDFNNLTSVQGENFESGWVVGPITGQNPNWDDSASFGSTVPEIVNDPTGAGQGQVLKLDAVEPGTWPAAVWSFTNVDPSAGYNVAVIRWKQFRVDLEDDLWINPSGFRWGIQNSWDHQIYVVDAWWEPADSRATPTAGVWETVELRIDFADTGSGYKVYVNGQTDACMPGGPVDSQSLSTMYWDLTGTNRYPLLDPPALAKYDTGTTAEMRSAVMGPDGKIYYQDPASRKLVALAPVRLCRGDFNCDGLIDFADIDPFVAVLSGGTCCDGTGYNCDVNGNGTVGFDDIDPFVALLSSGATCP